MGQYEQITEAMKLFGLNEFETRRDIKKKIAALLKNYHPDTTDQDNKEAGEKSISLIEAKKIIIDYIDNYRISFRKEDVEQYLSPHELWMRQFGNDPMWGNGQE